ncbi:MAG TPA: PLP-dependent aminotransferase family protein [Candidatus Angelobacter sp.]|nr:PLP-dependent aminotransferase family protein [Candidatus Angelobacter sp.]
MKTIWPNRYTRRAVAMKSSAIRELLKVTQRPDMISFAGGLPAPELFPIPEFQSACTKVLTEQGSWALQYSTTEGFPALRQFVADELKRYDAAVGPENVLITSGSQQALDLVGKLLIDPGDLVVVEAPTYVGGLQAFNLYEPHYWSIPVDDDGLRTELLVEALRARPKFLYVLPNFQNPSGVTMSLQRRQELLALAAEYDVPVVEDDPYCELRFEGETIAPLLALDPENVIYLGTFSKTLSPGLRVGWIVAPAEVIIKLVQLKQGTDLHTGGLNQLIACEVAQGGFLDHHVKELREVYRQRRDAMLQALTEFFPKEATWTHPKGGMFLWVTMPAGFDCGELLKAAVQENVAFVPGHSFFAESGDGSRHMRLNFSNAGPDRIQEGIRRISVVARKQMEQMRANLVACTS